jgi:hypothetical protein
VGSRTLLGGSLAAASLGIGFVLASVRQQQRRSESDDPSWHGRSGGPELPDTPLGVPAGERSGNGGVELPGFPPNDPTHG